MISSLRLGSFMQGAMALFHKEQISLPLKRFVTKDKTWIIEGKETEKTLNLETQAEYETIFTVGNGYAGTRAIYEEPMTPIFDRAAVFGQFLAGIFDQFDSSVDELVVTPSWTNFRVFIDGYQLNMYPITKKAKPEISPFEIVKHERVLDMKKGLLYRHTVFKDWMERITHYESLRFMSFHNPHTFIQRVALTPENYDNVDIQIQAEIDGHTRNQGPKGWEPAVEDHVQAEYRAEKHGRHHHYELTKNKFITLPAAKERAAYLEAETLGWQRKKNAKKLFGYASNLKFYGNEDLPQIEFAHTRRAVQLIQIPKDRVKQNKSLVFDKFVSVYTSRDYFGTHMTTKYKEEDEHLESNPKLEKEVSAFIEDSAVRNLKKSIKLGFDEQLNRHAQVMEQEKWKFADFEFLGNDEMTKATRFNLYHLIIAGNSKDQKAPIGARTLSGDAYNGHSFWDTEIFLIPFFIYTQPEVAKNLLLFRYKTLPEARKNAQKEGYRGAKYPWESGEKGTEQTPVWVGSPTDPERIWTGDEELHISSDVVYACVNYYNAHKDDDFLSQFGLEIMIEVSRFWASRMKWNAEKKQYDIERVIGPDESHEHVTNSAFTNFMAKWCLEKTMQFYKQFKNSSDEKIRKNIDELSSRIVFNSEEEFKEWEDKIEKIALLYDPKTKLIEEFDGYFKKLEVPITKFDQYGLPDLPDGISEIWPFVKRDPKLMHISATKLVKQADIVQLCCMLNGEKGYPFDYTTNRANFEYYEPRCVHKSSLSPATHSLMGISTDHHQHVMPYFKKSLMVDLENNRGNTPQGIHVASIGGTWQICVYGFGGLSVQNGQLHFHPWIPSEKHVANSKIVSNADLFDGVRYKLCWRKNIVDVTVRQGKAFIKLLAYEAGGAETEDIVFLGKQYTLKLDEVTEIDWSGYKQEKREKKLQEREHKE